MDKETLLTRLQQQKQQLELELTKKIVQIENIDASIQLLTIGRLLVDNKKNVRTPGVGSKLLIRELNTRIEEVEAIINSFDNDVERLNGRRDPHTLEYLHKIQEDRDKLRIELEFYKDLVEALQSEPKKSTQGEIDEAKYKAKEWYERRNPKK
jgi:hypothetical protein